MIINIRLTSGETSLELIWVDKTGFHFKRSITINSYYRYLRKIGW